MNLSQEIIPIVLKSLRLLDLYVAIGERERERERERPFQLAAMDLPQGNFTGSDPLGYFTQNADANNKSR